MHTTAIVFLIVSLPKGGTPDILRTVVLWGLCLRLMGELLVIGHVTRDLIHHREGTAAEERLGGAATYVSLAAARLGLQVRLVTAAPENFALMRPLFDEPRITVECAPSKTVTTFELDYRGPGRTVRLLERAAPIVRPTRAERREPASEWVYLGPVIGELPIESLSWFPSARVVVGLQGFVRAADNDGYVRPIDPPSPEQLAGASAVVFSEHDLRDAEAFAARLARQVPVVALTRGARGATLYEGGAAKHVAPAKADERDATGAGDVFGAALTVGLARGAAPVDAASQAAYAAARAVEGPGLGNLR